jgi:enamine deaminase RidA (YjgF/YER057c/UK114 family)
MSCLAAREFLGFAQAVNARVSVAHLGVARCVAVKTLPLNTDVEIEAIAVL